jgi:hypothetical protein
VRSVAGGIFSTRITGSLDRRSLIRLVLDLLYTVQVSFRVHAIAPEPVPIIGLIAAVRRVPVETAEFGEVRQNVSIFESFAIEIAALTAMILVLVAALVLLRRPGAPIAAARALPVNAVPMKLVGSPRESAS